MLDIHQQAVTYFKPNVRDPWRWAEAGRVVVWADGTTIAFREELEQIFDLLGPDGLPPFLGFVLLLGGCRGKVPQPELSENPVLQGFPSPCGDPENQDFSEFIAC